APGAAYRSRNPLSCGIQEILCSQRLPGRLPCFQRKCVRFGEYPVTDSPAETQPQKQKGEKLVLYRSADRAGTRRTTLADLWRSGGERSDERTQFVDI